MNADLLHLGEILEDFSTDNMKKLDYTDMSMIYQSITIILTLMVFGYS